MSVQVHIQTIGILVAEKTELQSSLNQSQKTAESRHGSYYLLPGCVNDLFVSVCYILSQNKFGMVSWLVWFVCVCGQQHIILC